MSTQLGTASPTEVPYTFECPICHDRGTGTVPVPPLSSKTAQLVAIKQHIEALEIKCKNEHPVPPNCRYWAAPDQP
jgi:hypothetical protein